MYSIRLAQADEVSAVFNIEATSHEPWDAIGYDFLDASMNQPLAVYEHAQADARLLVSIDDEGEVVGFSAWGEKDNQAFIHELGVDDQHQRQGIGQALLDATCLAAKESGYSFIALTTYRDVPFNRPWYERNGFSVIPEDDFGPELAAVRNHERQIGLDQRPRVCMHKAAI